MASAIVERSVVGVIESRGAVLCLGCGVVSGMGVGGQIRGRCQTCQAKFDARMEEHCCTTAVAERVAGILRFAPQSSGSGSVAPVHTRPGLALRHAGTLVGAPFGSLGGREAAVRSLAALRLP